MSKYMPSKEEIEEALIFRHTKTIQDKLFNAKVAVCGLGGLGSAVAISLARAGVSNLHLIDFDCVDLQNLNRQQYPVNELFNPKPYALKREILRFSPYLNIKTDFVKLTEKNIPDLLNDDIFICEAFDDPEQKAMLINTIFETMPDKYVVGASGMAGFGKSNEIVTKKITNNFFLCGDGISEISDNYGLMAPRVMICAAHQANKIIELIVNN